ncbi:MAG: hypothetical protein UZ07_CHB004001900 [Chlorobi bacterium OLB7]|nr:MAG: hypothetical protein UZ07_CHB004001900 [Chlorobi bacterium OLB7]
MNQPHTSTMTKKRNTPTADSAKNGKGGGENGITMAWQTILLGNVLTFQRGFDITKMSNQMAHFLLFHHLEQNLHTQILRFVVQVSLLAVKDRLVQFSSQMGIIGHTAQLFMSRISMGMIQNLRITSFKRWTLNALMWEHQIRRLTATIYTRFLFYGPLSPHKSGLPESFQPTTT